MLGFTHGLGRATELTLLPDGGFRLRFFRTALLRSDEVPMGPPIDLLGRWTKRGDKLHLHLDEYLEGLWDEPLVCEPTPDGLAVYRFGLHVQTLRRVVD